MNDSEMSDLRAIKFFPHLKIFNHTYNGSILCLIEKLYWLMWVKQLQNSTELHTPKGKLHCGNVHHWHQLFLFKDHGKTPIETHQGVTGTNWVMFT